jgi:5-methylcytosine-specific restriction protein A
MRTFLLKWNPEVGGWPSLDAELRGLRGEDAKAPYRWSTGNRRDIPPGSRFYLLRQGGSERGLVACGRTLSPPALKPHWDQSKRARGEQTLFVDIEFDRCGDVPILPMEALDIMEHRPNGKSQAIAWQDETAGIEIHEPAVSELAALWPVGEALHFARLTELQDPETYPEEAKKTVAVNAYERSEAARQRCLEIHGAVCAACRTDLASIYGAAARGLVEIHHLNPLATRDAAYQVDPERDLVPLCPNCHAVAHRGPDQQPYSVAQLQELIATQQQVH